MTIKLTWDGDDKRVIRWDLYGDCTIGDFEQASAESYRLLDQQSNPVFIILNPTRKFKLSRILVRYLWSQQPDARVNSFIIISNSNLLLELLLNLTFAAKRGLHCHFIYSLDSAYNWVADKLSIEYKQVSSDENEVFLRNRRRHEIVKTHIG